MSGGVSEGADAQGERLVAQRFLLRLTVSNLNEYAVQVLEVALKTPEMDVPVTAEVAAVVPPEGSVTLEEPLADLTGDEGRLNLYFYTAGSKRIYRVGTSFALEPWNNRYKVSPLNQTVAPTKQLASTGVSRVQERVWQERAEPTPHTRRSREPERDVPQERAVPKVVRYPEPTEAPRHGGVGVSGRVLTLPYAESSASSKTTAFLAVNALKRVFEDHSRNIAATLPVFTQ